MGVPQSETAGFRFPADDTLAPTRTPVPLAPEPSPADWPVRHIVLFLLTLVSTTLVGIEHYQGFQANFTMSPVAPESPWQYYLSQAPTGLWYAGGILAILGAHEFGHYYACRHYAVDASLPYFLPMPLFFAGTLGAFIRIRQPICRKQELFDIGIAGPIAGFVVAVPVLVLGILLSRVSVLPPELPTAEFGEPLLFRATAWLVWGAPPAGSALNLHPLGWAAWFGMLATALNLMPVGQLDGGHISYAVFGRRSFAVTLATLACMVSLSLISPASWTAWTVITGALLAIFGARHPPTYDEAVPLDSTRLWLAAFAVLMFILCFTPVPIEL
jgi:membrane-associated protease RseP (regulator of RpoE activity)